MKMEKAKLFKNKYFNKKFTTIKSIEDDEMEITRDWYEVYRLRAIEISRKHKIFAERSLELKSEYGPGYGSSITDDDTIRDWIHQYDGDLGQLQIDYPKLTMGEIIELFTWNTMCQERAWSATGVEFIQRMWYPETK